MAKINTPVISNQPGSSVLAAEKYFFYKNNKILTPLFDMIDIGVCVTDNDGYFADVNEAYCKIYGYSKDELIGKEYMMVIPDQSKSDVQNMRVTFYTNNKAMPTGLKVQHKDGSLLYISISTTLLIHTDGREYMVTSIKDITQNKIAEAKLLQSENKYRSIIENSLMAFFLLGADGEILDANKAALNMFGYSLSEFKSLNWQDIFNDSDADYLFRLHQEGKKIKAKGTITALRKNGGYFPCEFSSIVFKDSTGDDRISTMIIDIDERRKAQRQIDLLMNNTEESFMLVDRELNIISFNKKFEKEYKNISLKHLQSGTSILQHLKKDAIKNAEAIYAKVFNGENTIVELAVTNLAGDQLIIENQFKPIADKRGKVVAAFSTHIDITAKKKTEQQLFDSEKRYRALVENGTDVVVILTENASPLYVSPPVKTVLGYPEEEAMKINIYSLLHPDNTKEIRTLWKKIVAHPATPVRGLIFRLRHKNGSWRWLESTVTNMLHNSSVAGIVANFSDITDRVEAAEKIRQSEENLQAIFENTKEGFVLIDTSYCIKTFNENARKNIFIKTEMYVGANIFDFIEPSRKAFFKNIFTNALKGKVYQYEHLLHNKLTRERLWINFSITPVKENGLVKAVCITGRDITEQKAAETLIHQKQHLLNSAESIARIGSAEINFYTNKRIWSNEFYRILGLQPGTIPSKEGILEFLPKEEKAGYLAWLKKGVANKIENQHIETKIIRADGEERNIMAYGSATYNNDGKANTLIGVIQDITERKKMEKELQVSKEVYQSLFYQNPSAVFSLDMEGNFTSANNIFLSRAGCSQEKILTLNYTYFLHPDDVAATNIHFEKTKKGEAQEYKVKLLTETGNLIIAAMISLPIIIDTKITGIYCMANDITDEINAKIILDKTLADRQRILDYSLDVICEFNENGNFIQVSKACKELWGYEPEEVIGKKYIDFVVIADRLLTFKRAAAIAMGGPATRSFENRVRRKDGTIIHLIWSARWDKKAKTMYCIAKDASEKKAREQALVASDNRYRDLFNKNPLPLCIFNFSSHGIIEVNDAAIKKYGYNRQDFLSLSIKDIFSAEDTLAFEQILKNENYVNQINKIIWKHIKKNGETMHMHITGNIIDYNGTGCVLILLDDVTEKIKAESQKESERREKEALINNTDDQIWSLDKNFKLIAGNKSFIKIINSHTGKIFKQGDYLLLKDIFPTELINTWRGMYSRALSGESFKKEMFLSDSTSPLHQWNEVSFNPIYNGMEITGIACHSRNITENKLHRNELLGINKKLETAQQMARLGYWEINIVRNSYFWSKEIYAIFGLEKTTRDMSLEIALEVVHPDDRKMIRHELALAIATKKSLHYEHRILFKDGSIKVVVTKGSWVYDEKGLPIALEGTVQDITQQKLAEKKIKDSEEKYRMIFNSNPLPNWIYDLETLQILEVNNAAITHYGYTGTEFLTMHIKDLFVKEDALAAIQINKDINNYGIMNFGQWRHFKKDGTIINVDITGHAIYYNNKNAVMIVSNDITEIIQAQQELAKSNERFEYATKATFDAIWDYDLVKKTLFWGEGFYTLFGYNLEKITINMATMENLAHPDDKEKMLKSLQEVIDDPHQTYWQSQYRFKKIMEHMQQ